MVRNAVAFVVVLGAAAISLAAVPLRGESPKVVGSRPSASRAERVLFDENSLWREISRNTPSVITPFADAFFLDSHTVLAHYRYADGGFYGAYTLDLRTKKIRFLPRLTREMQREGWLKPDTSAVSPDHKWVLWRAGYLEREYAIVAARLDGSRPRRWPARALENQHEDELFWLPGFGHRFVNFFVDADYDLVRADIYALDSHRRPRQSVSLKSVHAGSHILGLLPDGTALAANDGKTEFPSVVNLVAFSFAGVTKIVWRSTIRCGPGQGIQNMQLSPDGHRLVWLIQDKGVGCMLLRVTDLQGGNRRDVTRFPLKDDDAIYCLGWTPDSRSVLIERGLISLGQDKKPCPVISIAVGVP